MATPIGLPGNRARACRFAGGTVELVDVAAFVEMADDLSLTATSARLYVSQPTLTRRLRKLERAIGITLYQGHGRAGVELTNAGRCWLPAARKVLIEVAEAERRATELRSSTPDEAATGV
jgi:LysR family transcriptional regulator, transcription activator of glutamate synthase operon